MSITLGADPESFATDTEGNIISCIGLIGGTKDKPIPVNGGALQEDNVLAEFNIEPHTEFDSFSDNIDTVIEQLLTRIPGIEFKPYHYFDRKYLISQGHAALEFGCDPDYNAWTGGTNTPPSPYTEMRTAAGHIHIGYADPNTDTNNKLIQLCDLFAGVPSVIMQPGCKRREMYGKAGAMRHKPYGAEYRVLSNFWLTTKEYRRWAWDAMHRAYNALPEYDEIMHGLPDVQAIINESRTDDARHLCKEFNISYV